MSGRSSASDAVTLRYYYTKGGTVNTAMSNRLCPTLGPLFATSTDVRQGTVTPEVHLVSCTYAGFKLLARQPNHHLTPMMLQAYYNYWVADTDAAGLVNYSGGARSGTDGSLVQQSNTWNSNMAAFLLANASWMTPALISGVNGSTSQLFDNSKYLFMAGTGGASGYAAGDVSGTSAPRSMASYYCSLALPDAFCPTEFANEGGRTRLYDTDDDYYSYGYYNASGSHAVTLNGIQQVSSSRAKRCSYLFNATSSWSGLPTVTTGGGNHVLGGTGFCFRLLSQQLTSQTGASAFNYYMADSAVGDVCRRSLFALTDSESDYTTAYNAETAAFYANVYASTGNTVSSDFLSSAPSTPVECACKNKSRYYSYWEVRAIASDTSAAVCGSGYTGTNGLCATDSSTEYCWWSPCFYAGLKTYTSTTSYGGCPTGDCVYVDTLSGQMPISSDGSSCACNICANVFCAETGGTIVGSNVSQSLNCSFGTAGGSSAITATCCSSWIADCVDAGYLDADSKVYTFAPTGGLIGEVSLPVTVGACSSSAITTRVQNVVQVRLVYGGSTGAGIGLLPSLTSTFVDSATVRPDAIGLKVEAFNANNSATRDGSMRVRTLGTSGSSVFVYLRVPSESSALRMLLAEWVPTSATYGTYTNTYRFVAESYAPPAANTPPALADYGVPSGVAGTASARWDAVGVYETDGVTFTTAVGSTAGDRLANAYTILQNGSGQSTGRTVVLRFTLPISSFSCSANQYALPGAVDSSGCVCNAGYYAGVGGVCTVCPAGSYCNGGLQTACPSGKSSCSGAIAATDCVSGTPTCGTCTSCPVGASCNALTSTCVCQNGYYLSGGSCTICPAGSYCTGGVQTVCPSGTTSSAGATVCSGVPSGSGGFLTGLGLLWDIVILVVAVLVVLGLVLGLSLGLRRRKLAGGSTARHVPTAYRAAIDRHL